MILHKQWGEVARLGNFLFKYASLIGLSRKYDTELYLPTNYMFNYFKIQPKIDTGFSYELTLLEPKHCFVPDFWDLYRDNFKTTNVNIDLSSFLQSSKYWVDYEDDIISRFEFKNEYINTIKEKYKDALSKKTIGISIRRGDFVNHPMFFQIPLDFYTYSLEKYFADYKDFNIIIFSDDQNYIRQALCGDNIYYADGNFIGVDFRNNPMEQLILGSLCDNFIISNSTFSWWLGYLAVTAKKSDGKVIHCGENFNMNNSYVKTISANPNDYYDNRWIKSDYLNNKQ